MKSTFYQPFIINYLGKPNIHPDFFSLVEMSGATALTILYSTQNTLWESQMPILLNSIGQCTYATSFPEDLLSSSYVYRLTSLLPSYRWKQRWYRAPRGIWSKWYPDWSEQRETQQLPGGVYTGGKSLGFSGRHRETHLKHHLRLYLWPPSRLVFGTIATFLLCSRWQCPQCKLY